MKGERLAFIAYNHPYQSTIADHTEILVQSILFNGLRDFERLGKQRFAQMTADSLNSPHENTAKIQKRYTGS